MKPHSTGAPAPPLRSRSADAESARADRGVDERSVLLDECFAALPAAVAGAWLTALLLVVSLAARMPLQPLLLWFALLSGVLCGRLLQFWSYRVARRRPDFGGRPWLISFRAGAFLSGLAWAEAAYVLFPLLDVPGQMLLGFVLAALAALAFSALAADPWVALAYTAPFLLALVFRLLQSGQPMWLNLSGFILIQLGFIAAAAWRTNRQLRDRRRLAARVQQREAELREQRIRLDYLTREAPLVLYSRAVVDEWAPTMVSPNVESLFGHAAQRLLREPGFWIAQIHPLDRADVEAALLQLQLLGSLRMEYRIRHADGRWRWVRDEARLVRGGDGRALEFVGTWQDISEERDSRFAAQQSETRLLESQRRARIGHWEAELVSGSLHWSPLVFELFGLDPARYRPDLRTFHHRVHAEDVDKVRAAQQFAMHQPWVSLACRILRPDGEIRHLQIYAERSELQLPGQIWLTGTAQDVTERVLAEAQLRATLRWVDSLLDNLPALVVVKRPDDLVLVRANRSAQSVLGFERGRIQGRCERELLPGRQGEARERNDRAALADPAHACVFEEVVGDHAGRDRYLLSARIATVGADGRPEYLLVVSIDRTEQIEAARIKREFVAVVSHELRTPLTSIVGAVDLLALAVDPAAVPDAPELLGIAQRNCQRLRRLVDDLLDMERLLTGSFPLSLGRHNLADIALGCVQAMRGMAAQAGVTLRTQGRLQGRCAVDAGRVEQVLANLIGNAIKFSDAAAEVAIELVEDARAQTVRIVDVGCGIDEAAQAHLFEPFFRVDNSDRRLQGGSGLGLAISRRLTEAMGGRIGHHANGGRGSVFWVEFPLAAAAAVASAAAERVTDASA